MKRLTDVVAQTLKGPALTRPEQFQALLQAITDARRNGNQEAREDAEGALKRFLMGEEIEMLEDFKKAQLGERETA